MALPVKGLEEAVLRFLKKQGINDAVEIRDMEEEADTYGGCETCGPTYDYTVDIWYWTSFEEEEVNRYGRTYKSRPLKSYTYGGKFGDLIQNLTDD